MCLPCQQHGSRQPNAGARFPNSDTRGGAIPSRCWDTRARVTPSLAHGRNAKHVLCGQHTLTVWETQKHVGYREGLEPPVGAASAGSGDGGLEGVGPVRRNNATSVSGISSVTRHLRAIHRQVSAEKKQTCVGSLIYLDRVNTSRSSTHFVIIAR